MLGPVLASLTRPPAGFSPPDVNAFDYTKTCLIGGGSYCITKVSFWTLMSAVIIGVLFFVAFRNPKIVPRGLQNAIEAMIEFVRNGIVMETMGPDGLPFLPFLTALFFFIWLNNFYEVVPGIQFPTTATMSLAALLTLTVYLVFNVVGIVKQGGWHYIKGIMFPPGVPIPIYFLYTPIELVSVFLVRPLTLAVRLTANMIAGHLILATFFIGTWYLQWKIATIPIAALSFSLGVFMTGFEVLVTFLQAYIFTILTAVYISGALHPEH